MQRDTTFRWLLSASLLTALMGCAETRNSIANRAMPESADSYSEKLVEAPRNTQYLSRQQARRLDLTPDPRIASYSSPAQRTRSAELNGQEVIQRVSHRPDVVAAPPISKDATLTVDGQTYRIQLVEEQPSIAPVNPSKSGEFIAPAFLPMPDSVAGDTLGLVQTQSEESDEAWDAAQSDADALQLNLPTALSMIGGQHPAVGFAQWRVQEAYADLDRAQVLWLPSIQPGFSFHRHDGNYQASNGAIVDVNRNSFQYGFGAGAIGAGSTPRPGLVAQFHLADAIFQPEIAEKTAWARGHAANGVVNEQLLNVALSYLELLDAEQDIQIVSATMKRATELAKLTSDYAAAGQGLQADADRMQTELRLVENRLATARERADVASARLSETLSIDVGQRIKPLDPTVVPIELVSPDMDKGTLISTGLTNRPELKEAQALVAAASEAYERQRFAPFVPSLLLGFSTGGYGGGVGSSLGNVNDRYDFDAVVTWEIRNLGFGEGAARRQSEAQIQQAEFEKIRVLDEVARQIAEAHGQVLHRSQRIDITQAAIQSAEDSYSRNLNRIRDGQGLPIEVLQSIQALEDARRAYLQSVIEYNEAQFRLQWALGWPVFAPE